MDKLCFLNFQKKIFYINEKVTIIERAYSYLSCTASGPVFLQASSARALKTAKFGSVADCVADSAESPEKWRTHCSLAVDF